MKYIKKYSSLIVESVKDDLKDFCEWNLAYLLDDDYKVMITRRDSLPSASPHHKQGYIIHFCKWVGGKTDMVNTYYPITFFEFSEVEDHFIPFLQRLSKEYTVIECVVDYFNVGKSSTRLSFEQVIDGGIVPDVLISRILVIVEEE
jgi:hypothetical protein